MTRPRAAGCAVLLLLAAVLVSLLIPRPAVAGDMLICRKFDREGDKKGRTIRLHGKGVVYSGGDGNDKIFGTPNDDLILGGKGNDIVYGLGGDDIVCGGTGNDQVYGGPGNDAVIGEEQNDLVVGGPGTDYVLGEAGNDRVLTYGDGLDFADGDYSKDVVIGGAGDQIFGGTLNDRLYVRLLPGETEGAAYMNGGYHDDRIYGTNFDDHIQGNIGHDKIYGYAGDDDLRGGGSNDFISGGAGSDEISGEQNRDEMHGGDGDDELTGGDGKDSFFGDDGFDVCNYVRKSEKLSSCEHPRQLAGRTPLEAAIDKAVAEKRAAARASARRINGGGKPGGQSGSAPFVTSDGYPFPDEYAQIAGFKTIRESQGTGGMRLLDKDSSHAVKPNVVALGTVYHPRKLAGVIRAGNGRVPVEWAYTNVCSRDYSAPDAWRSTGNHGTTPLKFKIKMPPKRGPKCDVAIWAKLGHAKVQRSLSARLFYR